MVIDICHKKTSRIGPAAEAEDHIIDVAGHSWYSVLLNGARACYQ